MRTLRKLWRYLTGPTVTADEVMTGIPRDRSRLGLTTQTQGDGTCQRDYDDDRRAA